jgi:2-amino-4-hydroxy-6-hydroxymethyldihydropteridine diphosphokinase
VKYSDWEAIYCKILDDFGYSRKEDEYSARVLATLVGGRRVCGPDCLDEIIGRNVTIYGFGPNLEKEMDKVKPLGTIISADGATAELIKRGIVPDIVTTDLDGDIDAPIVANIKGAVAAIHAHGDNVSRIREYVPFFPSKITPTTQSKPFDGIYNFGGFTDGDRAVMLARHFGASRIFLIGFDFTTARTQAGKNAIVKAKKLEWARKLIYDMNPSKVALSTP